MARIVAVVLTSLVVSWGCAGFQTDSSPNASRLHDRILYYYESAARGDFESAWDMLSSARRLELSLSKAKYESRMKNAFAGKAKIGLKSAEVISIITSRPYGTPIGLARVVLRAWDHQERTFLYNLTSVWMWRKHPDRMNYLLSGYDWFLDSDGI